MAVRVELEEKYWARVPPSQKGMSHRSAAVASHSPSDKELWWAAGIWEGEGSIGNTDRKRATKQVTLNVGVVQKDLWLLEKMKVMFGGGITTSSGDCYRWQVHGPRAAGFIQTIYSLLSPRRQDQVRFHLLRWLKQDFDYGCPWKS